MFKKTILALALLGSLGGQLQATDNETAEEFVTRIQQEEKVLNKEVEAAFWVRQNFITKDTAVLARWIHPPHALLS